MSVSIGNKAGAITRDEIVKEANIIWKQRATLNEGGVDEVMSVLRQQHPEFCESYPIVFRYMCEMGEYKASALNKYLKYIESKPWTTHEGYLDAQAEYAVFLYKATHQHYNQAHLLSVRKNIRAALQGEHELFMECSDKATSEIEQQEAALRQKNIAELMDFYKTHGTDCINIPIRMQTELPTMAATGLPIIAVESIIPMTADLL